VTETAAIVGFSGLSTSGLWHVHFSNGDIAHLESGYGARVLAECFGDLEKAVGKHVRYHKDWLGILEWFEPVGEN